MNPNSRYKLKLAFCLLVLATGLYQSFTNDSQLNNAILGLGILLTSISLNKPLNQ
jgi:hypothetical protein